MVVYDRKIVLVGQIRVVHILVGCIIVARIFEQVHHGFFLLFLLLSHFYRYGLAVWRLFR